MKIRLIHLPETDSTNRYLREECDMGNDDCHVVVADFQTAGRGQGTNSWESERGKNLLFSIGFHPANIEPRGQFVLSMAIANAIRRVMESLLKVAVEVKWPNDIYVGNRKICGILIETRLSGNKIKDCIIGIGLNVNQQRFLSDAPNPVSMMQVSGHEFRCEEVLDLVLSVFEDIIKKDDTDVVATEYRQHLYRREGFHPYRDAKENFQAKLVRVEDDGRLVLCDQKGSLRSYAFKEVEFLRLQ